jgi:2-methylcitrate dehydratase
MVAVALLYGDLKADYYEDSFATDPRIDLLRNKMEVVENPQFSKDYLNPDKRSIANAIEIYFKDGRRSEKVIVEYPIGHRQRRAQSISLLYDKFEANMAAHGKFSDQLMHQIILVLREQDKLEYTPVNEFMDMLAV